MKKNPTAKITKRTKPTAAGFLGVHSYEVAQTGFDGSRQTVKRDLLRRKASDDSVIILMLDPVEDTVIVSQEMRIAPLVRGEKAYPFGLPAGVLNKGETAIDAAVREGKEETGLELREPQVIFDRLYNSEGTSAERISIVFGIVSAPRESAIMGVAGEKEHIHRQTIPTIEFLHLSRDQMPGLSATLAQQWLKGSHQQLLKDYHPWNRLTQKIADPHATEDSILASARDYSRACAVHPHAVKVHGLDPNHCLPGLLLDNNRLDLAPAIHACLADSNTDNGRMSYNNPAAVFLSSLSAIAFTAAGDVFGHCREVQPVINKWLSVVAPEFMGKVVDTYMQNHLLGHGSDYVSYPAGLAQVLKQARMTDKVESWLQDAKSFYEAQKTSPLQGYTDGDFWVDSPGYNIREPKKRYEILAKVKQALVDDGVIAITAPTPRTRRAKPVPK